jgi:putative membrane protein
MRHFSLLMAMVAVLILGGCATYDPMTSSTVLPGSGFNEAEVAGILTAANEGEIAQGNIAGTRASSTRSFAQMMVTDHTNALNEARTLFNRRGLTPAETSNVLTLRNGSQQTIAALNTYSGSDFDRTYMQSQIDQHQWLLNTIDNALLPSTRSGDLRTFLNTQRTAVAHHLDRARQIMSALP